jgi:hypothetical protein
MPRLTDGLARAIIDRLPDVPDWWKELWVRADNGVELRKLVAKRSGPRCTAINRYADNSECVLEPEHASEWHLRWDGWTWKGDFPPEN